MSLSTRLRRFAFTCWGPAELGSLDDPVRPPKPVGCSRCGKPMATHTVVRGDHPPYFRCEAG